MIKKSAGLVLGLAMMIAGCVMLGIVFIVSLFADFENLKLWSARQDGERVLLVLANYLAATIGLLLPFIGVRIVTGVEP